jgi:hypothetical protein
MIVGKRFTRVKRVQTFVSVHRIAVEQFPHVSALIDDLLHAEEIPRSVNPAFAERMPRIVRMRDGHVEFDDAERGAPREPADAAS